MPYATSQGYIRYGPHELLRSMCSTRADEIRGADSACVIEEGAGIGLKYQSGTAMKRFAVIADSDEELRLCRGVLTDALQPREECDR